MNTSTQTLNFPQTGAQPSGDARSGRLRRIAASVWRALETAGHTRARRELLSLADRWEATRPDLAAQFRARGGPAPSVIALGPYLNLEPTMKLNHDTLTLGTPAQRAAPPFAAWIGSIAARTFAALHTAGRSLSAMLASVGPSGLRAELARESIAHEVARPGLANGLRSTSLKAWDH